MTLKIKNIVIRGQEFSLKDYDEEFELEIPSKSEGQGYDTWYRAVNQDQSKIITKVVEDNHLTKEVLPHHSDYFAGFGDKYSWKFKSRYQRDLIIDEVRKSYQAELVQELQADPNILKDFFPQSRNLGSSIEDLDIEKMYQKAKQAPALSDGEWKELCQQQQAFNDLRLQHRHASTHWEILSKDGETLHVFWSQKIKQEPLSLIGKHLASLIITENLYRACLSRAYLNHIQFIDSNLSYSVNTDSFFENTIFKGSDLSGADFSRSTFKNCQFEECQFSKTDFENAVFENCTFKQIQLDKGLFAGVKLNHIKIFL